MPATRQEATTKTISKRRSERNPTQYAEPFEQEAEEDDRRDRHSTSAVVTLGTTYVRANMHWTTGPGNPIIVIVDALLPDLHLCVIPILFLESSGDNSWAYVYTVLRCCVENGQGGMVIDHLGREHADESEKVPTAGKYRFRNVDPTQPSMPARGPQSNRISKTGAPSLDLPTDTISHSSRSSTNQSAFKEMLVSRDQVCLITETLSSGCVGAHIVPQSRSDVYIELLGDLADVDYRFHPSSGLLLSEDMHRRYDRYELSIYCKGDAYYIHVFIFQHPSDRQYHGKRLDATRFSRFLSQQFLPNKALLAWHYKQSAMARLRGYAYGMEANRRGGDVPKPQGAPLPGPDV